MYSLTILFSIYRMRAVRYYYGIVKHYNNIKKNKCKNNVGFLSIYSNIYQNILSLKIKHRCKDMLLLCVTLFFWWLTMSLCIAYEFEVALQMTNVYEITYLFTCKCCNSWYGQFLVVIYRRINLILIPVYYLHIKHHTLTSQYMCNIYFFYQPSICNSLFFCTIKSILFDPGG